MKTTRVTFLQDCANDRKGETKLIPADRAKRLFRTGYAAPAETPEDGQVRETAARVLAPERTPRRERRG